MAYIVWIRNTNSNSTTPDNYFEYSAVKQRDFFNWFNSAAMYVNMHMALDLELIEFTITIPAVYQTMSGKIRDAKKGDSIEVFWDLRRDRLDMTITSSSLGGQAHLTYLSYLTFSERAQRDIVERYLPSYKEIK